MCSVLRSAAKHHPHLPVIITEDGLSSNAPHIRDLEAARCHYLLGVKRGDHEHLFEQVSQRLEANEAEFTEEVDASTGTIRSYAFLEGLRLNEDVQDIVINTHNLAVPTLYIATRGRGFWQRAIPAT